MLLESRHDLDEVARTIPIVELFDEDVVPSILAGSRAPRQSEQVCAACNATGGAGLDGRCADLGEAEPSKQLTKARDFLFVDRMKGLWRDITARDPRGGFRLAG